LCVASHALGKYSKEECGHHRAWGEDRGWLTVLPNAMNGSILSDLNFWDGLWLLHYMMNLQNLPTHCDGCNAKCNIDHLHAQWVKDELGFLATLGTSPDAVYNEPFIFHGHAAHVENTCKSNSCPHS
jgi:hypothetical protein